MDYLTLNKQRLERVINQGEEALACDGPNRLEIIDFALDECENALGDMEDDGKIENVLKAVAESKQAQKDCHHILIYREKLRALIQRLEREIPDEFYQPKED